LFEHVPKRRCKVAISGQQVFEKIHAEKLDGSIKNGAVQPGEFKPPVPLSGKHPCDLQDQSRQFGHLVILMPGKGLEADNVPGRNNGLMKKPMHLVEPFDAVPLFPRGSLALFTDVNAMAARAELLVWARPTTDSAIMAHEPRGCYAPPTTARVLRSCAVTVRRARASILPRPNMRTSARILCRAMWSGSRAVVTIF
jgi:hypothetical protein